MPLCWIFLLKRRRALSNVSFSPTRTSANRCSPPPTRISRRSSGAADRPERAAPRPGAAEPPESTRGVVDGQTYRNALSERRNAPSEHEQPVQIEDRDDRPEGDDQRRTAEEALAPGHAERDRLRVEDDRHDRHDQHEDRGRDEPG